MTRRSIGDSNVMGKMSSELEQISSTNWSRLQLLDAAIRPTLACPLSQSVAEKIASDLGLHWVTVYSYRQRLLASNVTGHASKDFALLARTLHPASINYAPQQQPKLQCHHVDLLVNRRASI